jgi:hypothetical protein
MTYKFRFMVVVFFRYTNRLYDISLIYIFIDYVNGKENENGKRAWG